MNVPTPTSVTYIEHEDPFRLESYSKKTSPIYKLSPFAYVDCGSDKYVLELLTRGYIRIEKDGAL